MCVLCITKCLLKLTTAGEKYENLHFPLKRVTGKKELYSLARKTSTFSSGTTNKYSTKKNASSFSGWQSE